MRFGPWVPLVTAGAQLPVEPNVLQLRQADGLVDYPRGKSAMVHYELVSDLRAAAQRLALTYRETDLLCRCLIEVPVATDLAAFHAKLQREFVRRFGAAPGLP